MTEEDIKEWKTHPVTKEVLKILKDGMASSMKNALTLAMSDESKLPAKLAYESGVYDMAEQIVKLSATDDE